MYAVMFSCEELPVGCLEIRSTHETKESAVADYNDLVSYIKKAHIESEYIMVQVADIGNMQFKKSTVRIKRGLIQVIEKCVF